MLTTGNSYSPVPRRLLLREKDDLEKLGTGGSGILGIDIGTGSDIEGSDMDGQATALPGIGSAPSWTRGAERVGPSGCDPCNSEVIFFRQQLKCSVEIASP